MKEIDKKRVPSKDQRKVSAKPSKQDHRSQEKKDSRPLKAKDNAKPQSINAESTKLVSDSNTGRESSEVYEDVVIDYMDDTHRSNEASLHLETVERVDKDGKGELNGCPADLENEPKEGIDEVSDSDTVNDSVSSQGDSFTADDEKLERASRVSRATENESSDGSSQSTRGTSKMQSNSALLKPSIATEKFPTTANKTPKVSDKNVESQSENASEIPEVNGNPVHEAREDDILDQTLHGNNITAIDDERVNPKDNNELEHKDALCQKIVDMETRIEKLEEELREVAALEIALYSVVPEHGSSAHKVHTPARRLCRLYIHACKHLSSNNRATIAKNIVSGLVLIAKSCGNDVPRLTFWLSNTVVLREIICQTFGISHQQSFPAKVLESNKGGNTDETRFLSLQGKKSHGNIKADKQGIVQGLGDWQESRTFTTALEKIESWIFSRIVESIWWQTLTPNMQSLSNDSLTSSHPGRILGPSLGDQKQGNISINLWINAFQDAFRRLCPIRGEGHECGCLPVLARKVMEQCLARLDVAMFNAILRESVHEIPTDPVSDPIVDSKVLPIPAGDLSFGSGAQLKNCVGNWTRWLNNMLGMGSNDCGKDDQNRIEADDILGGDEVNCFLLLDSLSDLLMLPKDMLMDKSVRIEVCPQISLPLVKRILCNFTPDEFCPDSVPGAVLEALNAEYIIEHTVSRETARNFPYSAAPVEYTPPSLANVAAKIAEVGDQSQLSRSASTIQRKGYTSDEDLDELGSPLESIVEYKLTSSQTNFANGNTKEEERHYIGSNTRYELLRKVWSDS